MIVRTAGKAWKIRQRRRATRAGKTGKGLEMDAPQGFEP
jgi:hypothetical protein